MRHVYISFLQIIAQEYLNVLFKEKCSTKVSHDDDISNTKVCFSVCICELVLSVKGPLYNAIKFLLQMNVLLFTKILIT